MQRAKLTGKWVMKGGYRQGSMLGTGGRRVDAESEAYWELGDEGWIQTGKHAWNWRKKGGCRQGSLLGMGGRRVNADREVYCEPEEEG